MDFILGLAPIMIVVVIALAGITSLSACTEADKQTNDISYKAANFETPRVFTVVNARTDKVIFRITGTFSIQYSNGDVDIICKTGLDSFQKHFVKLNEWTVYIVEDLTGNGGDLYFTKVEYYPENEDEQGQING